MGIKILTFLWVVVRMDKRVSVKNIISVITRSLLEASVVIQVPRRELKKSPKATVSYERPLCGLLMSGFPRMSAGLEPFPHASTSIFLLGSLLQFSFCDVLNNLLSSLTQFTSVATQKAGTLRGSQPFIVQERICINENPEC